MGKRTEVNKVNSLFLWYLSIADLWFLVDPNVNISLAVGMRFKCLLILPLLVASLQAASVSDLSFTLNEDSSGYIVSACLNTASGALEIPNQYNSLPVTSIGDSVFWGFSDLTNITIPDSVTSIGQYTFYRCSSLTSITIPDSVTSIGNNAFGECGGLTNITIPNSITSIGDAAFRRCNGLTSITVPDSLTSIARGLFLGCNGLTSITIPRGVTSIGKAAFAGCSSLTSISIPNSVISIGEKAFQFCTILANFSFEGDAPTFGTDVFQYSNLVTVYYYDDATGFTSPTWQGIQSEAISRPAPIIAGIEKSEVGVNLWFNSASGQNYQIESSNDLENWTMLEDDIISEGDTVIRYYDTVGIQKRFYRVKRND